jgi:hypothetical protein
LSAGDDATILIPATVVAEIWRDPPRPRSTSLIEASNDVVPLTLARARAAGELLGSSWTTQIVDACVAALAIGSAPSLILTSDVRDLEALIEAAGADVLIERI